MTQDTPPEEDSSNPKPRYWFRVHHDTFFDDKIRPLPPAQRWVWLAILAAASKSPLRGFLLRVTGNPMSEGDLADLANVPLRDVKRTLPLFKQMKMIKWSDELSCWSVTNWDDRQYEKDKSAERTRRWRERERAKSVTEPSPCDADVTGIFRHRDAPIVSEVSYNNSSSSSHLRVWVADGCEDEETA